MIDIDKLQRVADRAMEIGADKEQLFSADEVISVFDRLRQAEKDAARYRWLRDTGCFEGSADDLFHATPAETDAEFDRFMQCNK